MRLTTMTRILSGLLLLTAIAGVTTPATADERGDGRGGYGRGGDAVLYRDVGFGGGSVRINGDISDLGRLGVNDAASSISIRGGAWQLCEDVNYRGRCVIVGRDVADFRKIGLNDKISSMRRIDDYRGGGMRDRDGLTVFRDTQFSGGAKSIDGDIADLRDIGINDAISSLRVGYGVWAVCEDIHFRGRCLTVDRDISDLGRFGLNDRISSVRRIR